MFCFLNLISPCYSLINEVNDTYILKFFMYFPYLEFFDNKGCYIATNSTFVPILHVLISSQCHKLGAICLSGFPSLDEYHNMPN